MIALAVATTPVDEVFKLYRGSGGRGRLENVIVGQETARVKSDFKAFTGLLSYWRDDTAHGILSSIGDQCAIKHRLSGSLTSIADGVAAPPVDWRVTASPAEVLRPAKVK